MAASSTSRSRAAISWSRSAASPACVEVRIKLTEEGPVLQMEAVQAAAQGDRAAVEIESARVEIKGVEAVSVSGGKVEVAAEEDVTVEAKGEVRVPAR